MSVATSSTHIQVESFPVSEAGPFPGSPHPARVYRGVLQAAGEDAAHPGPEPQRASQRAAAFEALFERHGWPPAWRAGLYEVHHYHASAHEVLGIFAGWVKARLGGPDGVCVTLRAGDAVLIPAGVAHCNEGQSPDFAPSAPILAALVPTCATGKTPSVPWMQRASRSSGRRPIPYSVRERTRRAASGAE